MRSSYLSRRTFCSLPLGLLAPLSVLPAVGTLSAAPLLLFDPASQLGVEYARIAKLEGSDTLAIKGDRVRLMQAVLAARPVHGRIVVISRYADFLLLSDVANEAAYRLIAVAQPMTDGFSLWGMFVSRPLSASDYK